MTTYHEAMAMNGNVGITVRAKQRQEEEAMCNRLASTLRDYEDQGLILPLWTHIPIGSQGGKDRNAARNRGARQKRMGARKGTPDFIFTAWDGRAIWLEMKYEDGKLSQTQGEFATAAAQNGVPCGLCYSERAAIDWLRKLGVIRG